MRFNFVVWNHSRVREAFLSRAAIPGKIFASRRAAYVQEFLDAAQSLVENSNPQKKRIAIFSTNRDTAFGVDGVTPFEPDESIPFLVSRIQRLDRRHPKIHIIGFFMVSVPTRVTMYTRVQLERLCSEGERSRAYIRASTDTIRRHTHDAWYHVLLTHPQEPERISSAMSEHEITLMDHQVANCLIIGARERARFDCLDLLDPRPTRYGPIVFTRPDPLRMILRREQTKEMFSLICDKVGMGKTLSAISILKYNGARSLGRYMPTMMREQRLVDYDSVEDDRHELRKFLNATTFEMGFQYTPEFDHESGVLSDRNAAGTLILCPLSLVSQWYIEVCRVIPAENVVVYHGPTRKRLTAAHLSKYDIVIMPTSLLPTLTSDHTVSTARFKVYLAQENWQEYLHRSTAAPWVYGHIRKQCGESSHVVRVFAQLSPARWSYDAIQSGMITVLAEDLRQNNIVLMKIKSRDGFAQNTIDRWVFFGKNTLEVQLEIHGVIIRKFKRDHEPLRSISLPFRINDEMDVRAKAADLFDAFRTRQTFNAPRFLLWTRIIVDECHLIPRPPSRTTVSLYHLARLSTIGISASIDKLKEGSIDSLTSRLPKNASNALIRSFALLSDVQASAHPCTQERQAVQFHETLVIQPDLIQAQQHIIQHLRNLIAEYTGRSIGFVVIQAIRMLRALTSYMSVGIPEQAPNVPMMIDRLTHLFMRSPMAQGESGARGSSRGIELLTTEPPTQSVEIERIPGGAQCPICLSSEEDEDDGSGPIEWLALLPCMHVICRECAQEMRRIVSCAMCRSRVAEIGSVVRSISVHTPMEEENDEEPSDSNRRIGHDSATHSGTMRFSEEKLNMLVQLLLQIIARSEKAVLFMDSSHASGAFLVRYLSERGIRAAHLSGSQTSSRRAAVLRDFAHAETNVLILRYRTGSVGLNLQHANHLIMFDLPSRKDFMDQAIGRIDRAGQTKQVHVYPMFCPETFEERVWRRWLQGVYETSLQQEFLGLMAD